MLVIRHIRQLITCAGGAPRQGIDQRNLPIIEDGAVAADGERILFAGADRDLPASLTTAPETRVIVAFLADTLDLPRRNITVVAGEKSRHKRVQIVGMVIDSIRARLLE